MKRGTVGVVMVEMRLGNRDIDHVAATAPARLLMSLPALFFRLVLRFRVQTLELAGIKMKLCVV